VLVGVWVGVGGTGVAVSVGVDVGVDVGGTGVAVSVGVDVGGTSVLVAVGHIGVRVCVGVGGIETWAIEVQGLASVNTKVKIAAANIMPITK
jgi:hypothetical protein